MEMRTMAQKWILQAENDLLWGKDSFNSKHFSQVCFISQQIGEKSLKALCYFKWREQ